MSKEAMKLALEALRMAWDDEECSTSTHIAVKGGIKALEEALAKQEQGEPVATVSRNQDDSLTFTPLYDFYVTNGMKLYAEPQQRTWVGLTDEERRSIWSADQMTQEEWDELFDTVEAKLKEKNA